MKTIRWGLRNMFAMGALIVTTGACCAQSGQVAATVEGSLLVVAGDNLNNQIVVSQTAAGDVVVTGQAGTLVNGLASVRFPRLQLNAAELRMGGGNDVVTLRSLRIANDLYVNLGAGADRIVAPAAAPTTIGANLAVEAAEGNDVVRLEAAIVGGDLFVDGGLGTLNANLAGNTVGFVTQVIGDDANDVVTLTSHISGDLVAVESKGGSDRITMTGVDSLLLGINTDANGLIGLDTVSLMDISTAEDIGVFTGPGNDLVMMVNVASAKNLTVSVDEGNDRVSGSAVSAAVDAVFEGGAGTDTFEDYGVTGGVKLEVKEFEILLP
jgi:hypothetical protein